MFLGFGSPLVGGRQVPHGTVVVLLEGTQTITRCVSCNTVLDELDRCNACNNGNGRVLRYLVVTDECRRGWRRKIAPSGHLAYLGTAHYNHAWLMRKPRWTCPLTRTLHWRAWRPLIQEARADRQRTKEFNRRYGI